MSTFALRIDTVVWDTQDSRHAIPARDDDQNFARMYFHLLKTSMKRRAPGKWHLHPDERLGMDWGTLCDCLRSAGAWQRYFGETLLDEAHSEEFFQVALLEPLDSARTPEIQLADLFAGMAAFSRKHAGKFEAYQASLDPQQGLFGPLPAPDLSNREAERFRIIPHLASRCKAKRLGVSLATNGYLSTPNPENPINFWHYQPQRSSDRAPTKGE